MLFQRQTERVFIAVSPLKCPLRLSYDAYILKSEKTRLCRGSGARLLRREVTVEEICLDFLLQENEKTLYAEVKCCTLVAGCGAYLPETLSQRMERHLRRLSTMNVPEA